MEQHDIVVIGAGPAGMAAAVAAYDAGVRDVVILDREEQAGGILKQCIHNGFGLHKLGRELTGPEYAAVYEKMTKERGIRTFRQTTVTGLEDGRVVTAQSEAGIRRIAAGAVVLAMGCRERSRGALMIPGTRPAGVYSAGTAQKMMNCEGYAVGRRVVILGSGDIGLIMARRMSLEGAKVEAVCEIMPYSGGLRRNIVQCLEDFGIPLFLSTTVAEIHGRERVEGVTIAGVNEKREILAATKRRIPCDTLLLSVGLLPENELTARARIPLDGVTGGATVDEERQTAMPGVFACGNVLQVHDLVDHASEEAEIAGAGAAAFVRGESLRGAVAEVRPGAGVRYVLPQRIHPESGRDVSFFLRSDRPYGKVTFTILDGEKPLAAFARPKASPGEMEKLTVRAEKLRGARGPITVRLEETE